MSHTQLVPAPTGRTSAVRVLDDWYVACASRELGGRPRKLELYGAPIVLFRDGAGSPAALLDRCPHRNAPLSLGAVREGRLECAYHGWQFDGEGTCQHVPGLRSDAISRGRSATSYACRERDGFVWIWATPDAAPTREPFAIPYLDDPRYLIERQAVVAEGTLHATAENALDVPHTAFLHAGLFRTAAKRNRIDVVVRREHDRIEAEFIGEPRPSGLAGRLLAPGGGVVQHWDRFILPCVIQVEYRLEETHVLVTGLLTPETERRTRLHAVVALRSPIPGFVVRPLVKPIALAIFGQDARMLRAQTGAIERFGGEDFTSTEIDVLGPAILGLLKAAARGERTPLPEPVEKRFHMHV